MPNGSDHLSRPIRREKPPQSTKAASPIPDNVPMASLPIRPRRNRKSEAVRTLVRETALSPGDLICPLFVTDGAKAPVASMPGVFRLPRADVVKEAKEIWKLGVPAVALFPALPANLRAQLIGEIALWIATAMTLITGWDYLRRGLEFMRAKPGAGPAR